VSGKCLRGFSFGHLKLYSPNPPPAPSSCTECTLGRLAVFCRASTGTQPQGKHWCFSFFPRGAAFAVPGFGRAAVCGGGAGLFWPRPGRRERTSLGGLLGHLGALERGQGLGKIQTIGNHYFPRLNIRLRQRRGISCSGGFWGALGGVLGLFFRAFRVRLGKSATLCRQGDRKDAGAGRVAFWVRDKGQVAFVACFPLGGGRTRTPQRGAVAGAGSGVAEEACKGGPRWVRVGELVLPEQRWRGPRMCFAVAGPGGAASGVSSLRERECGT
jgi:hypothetical protein